MIFNPATGAQGTFVCSNYFPLEQRTPKNPETDFPSIFLTVSDCIHSVSPKKHKANCLVRQQSSFEIFSAESPTQGHSDNDDKWEMSESDYSRSSENDPSVTVPMRFANSSLDFPQLKLSNVSLSTYFLKPRPCSTGGGPSRPKRNTEKSRQQPNSMVGEVILEWGHPESKV